MADSQLLTIVIIAAVAGIILFRLYTVLGRRTGNERPPGEGWRFGGMQPKAAENTNAPAQLNLPGADRPSDPVASGLFDIGLADRSFEKENFLKGAKSAYEMILMAFASGDKASLKPLLSDEVFQAFEGAISAREAAGQKANLTLVGFSDVKIIAASLKNNIAEITVAFGARLLSFTTDRDGTVVEGDAKEVKEVTDVWSFTRDVRLADPNWVLVATSSEPV
ncbi:putative lipid-binding transport protein (Tim44 family) [Rhizomicrobium palustre]|uniref:Putative lipid-binding transport protein (Tim44 family) n=1 Tax=Rhizomicrobium palustre TaxID=189966 RepID=A0A846MY07_9PROT|nr:Tim44/TimA family putative adaptor protein [Rhizomicrobium palustre]NIK88173.1 putative lipid-binding transport protein (Tim44 family) [Rhizomicrobium palustre]